MHPSIQNPAPSAAIINALGRDHKNDQRILNEYHVVDKAFKKIFQKLIPEKFQKSLASSVIGFSNGKCLQILTHLITKYAELEDKDVQIIDKKMKEPILGETLFEEFFEQIELNQETMVVQNPYTPYQIRLTT